VKTFTTILFIPIGFWIRTDLFAKKNSKKKHLHLEKAQQRTSGACKSAQMQNPERQRSAPGKRLIFEYPSPMPEHQR
jgi:hypothetical protein